MTMSFAQPIRRPVSSNGTSPSWLTSGLSARSSGGGPSSAFAASMQSGASPSGWTSASSGSRAHEQSLINAYEAEEERIINVLSRKLEQLREDKIDLENALEAESESHVNRLARELGTLRQANGELEAQLAETRARLDLQAQAGAGPARTQEPRAPPNVGNLALGPRSAQEPSATLMLDALQRENEALRNRLVDTERDYVRVSRLNEVYREELIEHRSRLGLSVDNLIGLTSSDRDPFAHPTHHRSRSSSASSSPALSVGTGFYGYHGANSVASASTSTHAARPSHGVPIPRPPSQIQRPHTTTLAAQSTPLSLSPSSPSPLSPIYSASSSSDSYLAHHRRYSGSGASAATPASFVSVSTNLTSPPGSVPNGVLAPAPAPRGLSYPSVPPPSLSSSFGSPTVSFHMPARERDASLSPVEPLSRRGSIAGAGAGRRVAETGSLRRASFDRGVPVGARVAETGSLVGRSRAGSASVALAHAGTLPETVVEGDVEGLELDEELDGVPLNADAGGVPVPLEGARVDVEGTPSAKSR